jgi:hypothetical protein
MGIFYIINKFKSRYGDTLLSKKTTFLQSGGSFPAFWWLRVFMLHFVFPPVASYIPRFLYHALHPGTRYMAALNARILQRVAARPSFRAGRGTGRPFF